MRESRRSGLLESLLGLLPQLLLQTSLSCSLGRMPALEKVFALYGQAATLCEHGASPGGGWRIEGQPLSLAD